MSGGRRAVRRWLPPTIATLAIAYAVYWLYRLLRTRLGAVAPLVLGVLAVPILGVALALLWRRYGGSIERSAVRAASWGWSHIQRTSAYRRLRERHPAVWDFVVHRLDPHAATGLGLSIVALAAIAALWAFLELLVEVVSRSAITGVDRRIINLFQALRTPQGDRLMLGATYVGSGRSVAEIVLTAVLIALVLRRRRDAAMLGASLLAGGAFFAIVKLIIRRPRPPFYDARIVQAGFSFPSGHATMASVLYGTISVLLVRGVRRTWLRVVIAVCATIAILWIGLSRVYLGVHYPSDVLAGWVGGAMWVLIVLAASHVWRGAVRGAARDTSTQGGRTREAAAADAPPPAPNPRASGIRRVVALGLGAACVALLVLTWPAIPAPNRLLPPAATVITAPQLLPTLASRIPRHTEGLFGHRQEPLNLIFVGDSVTLVGAFRAAGWVAAERMSWSSLRRALVASLFARADAAGPVTPSFYDDQPETLAFNQPVGRTFAQRHHIRIWRAPYAIAPATPIWLATASYDSGYAVATGSMLPVHQIAPAIDLERDHVARSLARAGAVADSAHLQLVPPESGTNAFGEPFFTYGQADVLTLRSATAGSR